MARKLKAAITADDDRQKIIAALQFASIAFKSDNEETAYVSIHNHWLTAENETFTIGVSVDVELDLCPQATRFEAALKQCGQTFQLTQVEADAVSIKSGAFRARVPALPSGSINHQQPDMPIATIGDGIRDAFVATLKMVSKGERVINQCVQLRSMSCVGTTGGVALEYWHGVNLPMAMNIPKRTVETIIKIGKPLAQFGWSDTSATFYFDDFSYVKTRLIAGAYPDVDRLFAAVTAPYIPIWPQLFVALKALDAFVDENLVLFLNGYLSTNREIELGASYEVPGLPGYYGFTPAYWHAIEPYVTHVAVTSPREPFGLYGPKARALIIGKAV